MLLSTAPCSAFSHENFVAYKVQPGDSLSQVLYDKLQLSPVYGKSGYINQVTWLNRGRILKRGDLIAPGDVLLIPAITSEALKFGAAVRETSDIKLQARNISSEVHLPPPKSEAVSSRQKLQLALQAPLLTDEQPEVQTELPARTDKNVHYELPKSESPPIETVQAVQYTQAAQPPQPATLAQPPQVAKPEAGQPQVYHSPLKSNHSEFWLWLGTGINYQYYQQTIPTLSSDTSFQNIKSPTALVKAGFQGEKIGMELSYKDSPGEIKSSKTVVIENGNYHWQTLSTELLYRLDQDIWNLRFGFQNHQMPFMILTPSTSTIEVTSNSLVMLTAGFDLTYPLSKKLRMEWLMRYQNPLFSGSSNGDVFKVTPKFAFDGSVGGVYHLGTETRLGIFWYGQWHQYGFTQGSGATASSGDQTLFYSNIELRLGYEF